MSWLARSIANSLKLDDDDDDDDDGQKSNDINDGGSDSAPKPEPDQRSQSSSPSSTSATTPRGVKEDLSELTKTLSRQFWGVASFLAPPPEPTPSSRQISSELADLQERQQPSDLDVSDENLIAGIRSDIVEISGKFKSGISKLSGNMAVSEISKIASNFLQFGSERDITDEDLIGSAVGVTEEVVAFARDISMHPETWLDFPVPDDEDFDDFDMTDAQQEHALAVEHLAPRLAALRMELCPGCMSEGCFWKIYFVLLHPRLNKQDGEILSTPQIVEARTMLSQELQNRAKAKTKPNLSEIGISKSIDTAYLPHDETLPEQSHLGSDSMPLNISSIEVVPPAVAAKTSGNKILPSNVAVELETEKHPVESTEMQIIDKAVVGEEPANHTKHQHSSHGSPFRVPGENSEDDGDDWLKEESSEMFGTTGTTLPLGNDEDVSFSDLEEDDGDVPIIHKKMMSGSETSSKESRDWVQLRGSSADSVKDINPVSVKHTGSEQVSGHNSETKESSDWDDVDDIDVM